MFQQMDIMVLMKSVRIVGMEKNIINMVFGKKCRTLSHLQEKFIMMNLRYKKKLTKQPQL